MNLELTAVQRRKICIHEAAHAVIHRLSGGWVYELAVAPPHSTSWTYVNRNGGISTDLMGVCSVEPTPHYTSIWSHISWNPEKVMYDSDRKTMESTGRQCGAGVLAAIRQEIRGLVAMNLAGPIADEILLGEVPYVWDTYVCEPNEDVAMAWGLVQLLPGRKEADHLAEVTEQALRHPPIWKRVVALADALVTSGSLCDEELDKYLPPAAPDWPPSPRMKPIALPN